MSVVVDQRADGRVRQDRRVPADQLAVGGRNEGDRPGARRRRSSTPGSPGVRAIPNGVWNVSVAARAVAAAIIRARSRSWSVAAAAREFATAAYRRMPRTISTTSVEPPLQSRSRRRTRRTSAASVVGSVGRRGPRAQPQVAQSGQPVADAADRLDPRRTVRPELAPEERDECIDGVRRDGHAKRPGLVEQLVARQRVARVAEEALEERELARSQIDGPPATVTRRRASSRTIGPLVRCRAVRAGGRARAASERTQPSRQLLVGEGLRQVVVGAGVEAGDAVVERVAGGQHDDRRRAAAGPEPTRDLEPVESGRPMSRTIASRVAAAVGHVEAVLAGLGQLDDVTVLAEEPAQQATRAADRPPRRGGARSD